MNLEFNMKKYKELPPEQQKDISDFLMENWKTRASYAIAIQSAVQKFLLVASGTAFFILTSNINVIMEFAPKAEISIILTYFLIAIFCSAVALYIFSSVMIEGVGKVADQIFKFKFEDADYETVQGWQLSIIGKVIHIILNLSSIFFFLWGCISSISLLTNR